MIDYHLLLLLFLLLVVVVEVEVVVMVVHILLHHDIHDDCYHVAVSQRSSMSSSSIGSNRKYRTIGMW